MLLESAVSAQNPSLWLHSRRQKPTASFLQHRSQFPSIWGLGDAYTAVSELCVPPSSAVSTQEAAQLGLNCISTQLVQTPLRPTLEELKCLQSSPSPRCTRLLCIHTRCLKAPILAPGVQSAFLFMLVNQKGQQITGVREVRESKTKFEQKALSGFTVKHWMSLIHLLFIFTTTQGSSSTFHQGTRKPQHCSQPSICRRDHRVTHTNTHSRLTIFGFFVCT